RERMNEMAKKISLQTGAFQENIGNLRSTITNVDSEIQTSETFEMTNMEPFTNDLENLIQSVELLERYKTLFHTDIDTLEGVGESLREQDERLSQNDGIKGKNHQSKLK